MTWTRSNTVGCSFYCGNLNRQVTSEESRWCFILEAIKDFRRIFLVDCSCTAELSGAHLQAWYCGCSNKTESPKRRRRWGSWLWICRARASKTAAGTNVGSHSNCNLIIVFRISSCSGLKKMTRCSFWKAFPLCCLGNSADFHTAERGAAQNLSAWFAPREACTPSPRPGGNLRGHSSLVSLQSSNHKTLWRVHIWPNSPLPFLTDLLLYLLHLLSDRRE